MKQVEKQSYFWIPYWWYGFLCLIIHDILNGLFNEHHLLSLRSSTLTHMPPLKCFSNQMLILLCMKCIFDIWWKIGRHAYWQCHSWSCRYHIGINSNDCRLNNTDSSNVFIDLEFENMFFFPLSNFPVTSGVFIRLTKSVDLLFSRQFFCSKLVAFNVYFEFYSCIYALPGASLSMAEFPPPPPPSTWHLVTTPSRNPLV